MTDLTLLHNPRCSKSRAALALLQARDLQPRVIDYLNTPLDHHQLRELLVALAPPAGDLLRRNETTCRELGLDRPGIAEDTLIAAMAAHPHLMERPILIRGTRAVIGRPPERILELL